MVHVVHALMIQWAHNLLGLWVSKGNAKDVVTELLDCCRALPLQVGSARGMFSNWDALHLGMFQVYWERDDV